MAFLDPIGSIDGSPHSYVGFSSFGYQMNVRASSKFIRNLAIQSEVGVARKALLSDMSGVKLSDLSVFSDKIPRSLMVMVLYKRAQFPLKIKFWIIVFPNSGLMMFAGVEHMFSVFELPLKIKFWTIKTSNYVFFDCCYCRRFFLDHCISLKR